MNSRTGRGLIARGSKMQYCLHCTKDICPLHKRNNAVLYTLQNFMVFISFHGVAYKTNLAILSCCVTRFIGQYLVNTYTIQNGASSDSSHTSPLPFEASSPSSSMDNLIYSLCANRSHSVRVGFSRSYN